MVAERCHPNRVTLLFALKNKVVQSPIMSMSLPTISMSDKEDTCIHEHEVALVKAKHVKEERQRQWEEEA